MVKLKQIMIFGIIFAVIAVFIGVDTRAYAALTEPKAVLADFDDRLTAQQEKEIQALMNNVAEKTQFHIAIVIANDLNGMSDKRYTDSFGFSAFGDSDWITLMLFNSYDKPEYNDDTDVISFHNRADDMLKRYDKKMFDSIYDVLEHNAYKDYDSDDIYHLYNYYGACKSFCSSVEKYGVNSPGNAILVFLEDNIGYVLIGFVIAAIISIIVTTATVKGYKKRKPISAAAYVDQSRTRVTRQVDQFVREYTTSVSTSSSSGHRGGGGGGGHHSSSHGHHR